MSEQSGIAGNRILIFERDRDSAAQLRRIIANAGAQEICCEVPSQAIEVMGRQQVHAAVIAVDRDGRGMEMLDSAARAGYAVPMLVAAPAEAVEIRVEALQRGAVDHLIKPIDSIELTVRLATAMRRCGGLPRRFIRRGDIVFDNDAGRLGDGSRWTMLTPQEQQACSLLFDQDDRPVSKNRLKDAIADGRPVTDNAVEVVIYRLRGKARPWGMDIRTYRGHGYALAPFG